jgi:hypothetical protein
MRGYHRNHQVGNQRLEWIIKEVIYVRPFNVALG